MARLRGLLTRLHARGLHAAVVAGLVMMPVVVATGFLSDRELRPVAVATVAAALRGSFDEMSPHGQ